MKERNVCKEEEEGISSYWITQGKGKILEFERRNTTSHPLEKKSLWKLAMDPSQDRLSTE